MATTKRRETPQERIEREEFARRQREWAAAEVEAPALLGAAVAAAREDGETIPTAEELPRELCALHGWAPRLRPGVQLPPASMCPQCSAAAKRASGPVVYLDGGGPVKEDPYLDAAWESWLGSHPEKRPAKDTWIVFDLDTAHDERDAELDHHRGRVVYRSTDGQRVQYAKPRKKPRQSPATIEAMATADGFWS